VCLTAKAGFLVAAEGRANRINVVAVGPAAARLDAAANTIQIVCVARPDARAEAVDGVIANFDGFFKGFELGDRNDRPEDLFLEDAHLVVAGEDGRLEEVAVFEVAAEVSRLAADEEPLLQPCHPSARSCAFDEVSSFAFCEKRLALWVRALIWQGNAFIEI